MKLKLDADGHVVVQDGKPVYVHDDGQEVAFDAPAAVSKIGQLNGEAQGHRQAKETAEKALKAFEGITDPAAAIKALETVGNLDAKRLVDAGQIETVKAEAIKAVEEKYAPVLVERDGLKAQLNNAIKGGAFANSKFVADKVAVPRHMLERTYGDSFKVEDGRLVPYDANGAKIFSRTKPGEVADFDEAIELLIAADPFKDHILKGTGAQGGGAGNGGGNGGAKTISRAEFAKLSPVDQMTKTTKDGFTVVD